MTRIKKANMNTPNQTAAAVAASTNTKPPVGGTPNPGNPNPVINRIELTAEQLGADVAAIKAVITKWQGSALTGQLSIAIGGLHRAVEYAQYHLALPKT